MEGFLINICIKYVRWVISECLLFVQWLVGAGIEHKYTSDKTPEAKCADEYLQSPDSFGEEY